MDNQARLAQARPAWLALAAQTGLAPEDWQMLAVASRRDGRHDRAVVGLVNPDGGRLILKIEFAPLPADDFRAMVDRLRACAARLSSEVVRMPAILAVDHDRQAILQDWLPGETAFDRLDLGQDRDLTLQHIGAAIDAFHRAGRVETRAFQPRYTVRYLRKILNDMRDGSRSIARPALFRGHVARYCDLVDGQTGHSTVASDLHGDLHLRNLLVGPDSIGLIDPKPADPGPVGHDLGRLLVDYAAMIAPPTQGAGAGPLPGVDLGPFFAGYRLAPPDDPSITLLCRMRILAEWIALPADAADRSHNQQRRFQGLLRLAGAAFG